MPLDNLHSLSAKTGPFFMHWQSINLQMMNGNVRSCQPALCCAAGLASHQSVLPDEHQLKCSMALQVMLNRTHTLEWNTSAAPPIAGGSIGSTFFYCSWTSLFGRSCRLLSHICCPTDKVMTTAGGHGCSVSSATSPCSCQLRPRIGCCAF